MGEGRDDDEEDTPRRRAAKAAMDQIEDEVDRITKALRHNGVSYPHSETTDLLHHQNLIPPPATSHSARGGGSYSLGATDVVHQPSRHAFDDLVDHIMQRDRVSAPLPTMCKVASTIWPMALSISMHTRRDARQCARRD